MTKKTTKRFAHRIAADWGTSNLRVFALDEAGTVFAEARSDRGMGTLEPSQYEGALLALVSGWLDPSRVTPVFVCGMAGARQGWIEAAYRKVPCTPVGGPFTKPKVESPLIEVFIVPGLSQDDPADVMRGEESQIAGVLASRPGFEGVLCLPGTHSKWAQVSAGEVVSFQTFMTGEMFHLLSTASVLRHGIGAGWDEAAFDEAVSDTLSRPQGIAARLFGIRAEGLLHALSPDAARARLSGLLIGAELAAARPYWLGQQVALVGNDRLSAAYARALAAQGVPVKSLNATDCTLAGLSMLRKRTEAPA